MRLAIDIGNSRTRAALYAPGAVEPMARGDWPSDPLIAARDWRERLQGLSRDEPIRLAAIASVKPAVGEAVAAGLALMRPAPRVLRADGTSDWGFAVGTAEPRATGADRLANAAGALALGLAPPILIVDIGTAATFDLVLPGPRFAGGAIAPGPGMMLPALASGTAQLPRVEFGFPPSAIGRDTAEALRAGAAFGYAGLVDGLIAAIEAEAGPCALVACGGAARLFVGRTRLPAPLMDLTFRGLLALMDRTV